MRYRLSVVALPIGGRRLVGLSLVLGLAVAWSVSSLATRAAEPADLIKQQIEAGEFGPAMAAVAELPKPGERDSWLGQIADAQSQAGARGASLATVGEINDDLVRAQALERWGSAAQGGGVEPDFDSLVELITGTIAPPSWTDVGGTGAIKPFPTGVIVDAEGTLRRVAKEDAKNDLAALRDSARPADGAASDLRRESTLRKVSLTRLERAVQLQLAAGRPIAEEMQTLAGLTRIRYVFVYPDTGDIVLAGPAGDWKTDGEGRIVNVQSGQPVVRLDDLVTLLRQLQGSADTQFGCAITPRQEGLARTKAFAEESSRRPLPAGDHSRNEWLRKLREALGSQDIEIYGVDPKTRVAQVLVEADYRMKLVGIGLEKGTMGVPSYLESIRVQPGQPIPPMDVLRWWFAMNYEAVIASQDHRGFEIRGQGVRVLSENEMLAATGERIHTGASNDLNSEFAHNFTNHFEALSARYPVYGELRNVFDLALVATLLKNERLAETVNWHLTCFGTGGKYPLVEGNVPRMVETVANHRVADKSRIIAVVSGGVAARPDEVLDPEKLRIDRDGAVTKLKIRSVPASANRARWWWD